MKLRNDIERTIYAIRLEARISMGYPQAWRDDDVAAGRPAGDRLEEWEHWCVDLAIDAGVNAVAFHREAARRRR